MGLFFGTELDLFAGEDHISSTNGAHFTAHRAGMAFSRRGALIVSLSLFAIDANIEHSVPVQFMACFSHSVIAVGSIRDTLSNISSMSSDLACHDTLLNVIGIRESEVFSRSNIAEEVSAAGSSDSAADSGSDVVITGSNISNERTEDIERSVMADTFLELHISLDLIHSHMTGTLDHYLNVLSPCAFSERTQFDELRDLTSISSVIDTTWTECITEADGDVEFAENIEHLIVVLIERVFVAGHHHPGEEE